MSPKADQNPSKEKVLKKDFDLDENGEMIVQILSKLEEKVDALQKQISH